MSICTGEVLISEGKIMTASVFYMCDCPVCGNILGFEEETTEVDGVRVHDTLGCIALQIVRARVAISTSEFHRRKEVTA